MLLPTGTSRGNGGRREATPRRRAPVARWKLAVGFVAAIAFLDLLRATQGMAAIVVLACGFAALGIAGWLWGYDSRDGADWRPVKRP